MKCHVFFSAIVVVAFPALAFEIEEIGRLKSTFNGQTIEQPTVIAKTEDRTNATAFLNILGGGFSSLSLTGFSMDNQRLDINAGFMVENPGPQSVPHAVSIAYAPTGTKEQWTSQDAPTPSTITLTTMEFGGEKGRAAGSFAGVLCYTEDYDSGVDAGKCHPIEGSFDTVFFLE